MYENVSRHSIREQFHFVWLRCRLLECCGQKIGCCWFECEAHASFKHIAGHRLADGGRVPSSPTPNYSILCSETNLCKSANTIITNNMHIGPEFPPRHHQNFAKPVAVSSKHPGNMPLFVKVLWIQILGIYWHILEPDPKHSYSNPSLLSSP
jgi:hypothetical protein